MASLHSTLHRIAWTCLLTAFASAVFSAEPDDTAMNILSFNIRYDNSGDGPNRWMHRREAVAKIIARADLAGLQEVVHGQLTDLQAALPEFGVVGVGREDGKKGGEYCPILYRRSRFELKASDTFWLSEHPEEVGSKGWDASLPRICTWAHFRDKGTNQEFYFFNTHFDHRGPQARRESGKLIARKVNEIAGDLPALLSGDFNATPESEPIGAILAAGEGLGKLRDSRTLSKSEPVGPGTTWNGFAKIEPNRRIDFIFVRGGVEVQSYREITDQLEDGRFPSDHLPVRVEVTLAK